MTNESILTTKQLIVGTIIALVIGAALTIFVVLPAEKGEDPTGFGETTGLTELSDSGTGQSDLTTVVVDADALFISIDPATTEIPLDDWGKSGPALDGANLSSHGEMYKTETIKFQLPLDGQVEYKAVMDEGKMLFYSWTASGDVYYDFHAHEDDAYGNPDFWTRYVEGEGSTDSGGIVAPYTGQHGWFWLNLMETETTIELTVTGYFDELVKIDLDAQY